MEKPTILFDCDGEFGDDEGTEEGYENCLWESGEWEEEKKDDSDVEDDEQYC